jgi:hypothetical protein
VPSEFCALSMCTICVRIGSAYSRQVERT